MSFKNANLIPKSARLLNNGDKLRIRVAPLPAFLDKSCVASVPHASVADIPCDEINEPIVIELEW